MAVTVTSAELAEAVGVDSVTAARLLAVATALVTRYAPDAPAAIQGAAVLRVSGWLSEAPASGVRSESIGDISTTYSPMATGALRASGGMSLLSPWKKRRAGPI